MTISMPQDNSTKDLLDWLGVTEGLGRLGINKTPVWLEGPLPRLVIFGLFLLLFLLALLAALLTLIRTISGTGGDGPVTGLGAGALVVALLGAPFLFWRTFIAHKTLGFQKEGHITERITKAVEQLGVEKTVKVASIGQVQQPSEESRPNIEVRIGGILSLERIAQDSVTYDRGRDHVRVMEILCAYIRENAPARGASDHKFGDWEPLQEGASDLDREEHAKKRSERFGGNGGAKVCHGSGVMVALRAA
jgi:hypothetical protein